MTMDADVAGLRVARHSYSPQVAKSALDPISQEAS